MMQARSPLILVLPAMLAACSSTAVEYPSLAMRDGERVVGSMAAGPSEVRIAPAPPPATVEEASELAVQAGAIHEEFLSALPGVRNRIDGARASAVGSEAWSDAQVALTILESHHGRLSVLLADLENFYVNVSSEGQAIAPLAAQRDAVAAMASEEAATIADLLSAIPR